MKSAKLNMYGVLMSKILIYIPFNYSEYLYSTRFILYLWWVLLWSNIIHHSWVKLSSILRPYFQKWDNYSFIFQFFLLVEKIVSNDSNCGFMNHGSHEICPIVIQIWDMIYSIKLSFHALHNKKCKKWICFERGESFIKTKKN